MIYFDWNATAPLDPVARRAWDDAIDLYWANPSTSYRLGARAKNALEDARQSMAQRFHRKGEELVFTSGATEANNAVFREFRRWSKPDARVAVSAIEHPSVIQAARGYWGDALILLPVRKDGTLDCDQALELIDREKPVLVTLMAANNETGVIQPWKEMGNACRDRGIAFHLDAAQWVGKETCEGFDLPDFITLSAHKFGGPKGVGGLVVADSFRGLRSQWGGAQENDHRAGTENIPGILAMAAALESREADKYTTELKSAPERAVSRLREALPDVCWHGEGALRLWNTLSLGLPEFRANRWVARLDKEGFAVSSGSACSTGKEGPSPVLAAMGVDDDVSRNSIRISSGWTTTLGDWQGLTDAIVRIYRILREENRGTDSNVSVIDI